MFEGEYDHDSSHRILILSQLGPLVHKELFQTAFLKCYSQILEDKQFKVNIFLPFGLGPADTIQNSVDMALVRLFSDATVSREIVAVFLDLLAFFNKERRTLPSAVLDAAKRSAEAHFSGELHQGVPAIAL